MYSTLLIGSQRCVACANFSYKSEPFGQHELYRSSKFACPDTWAPHYVVYCMHSCLSWMLSLGLCTGTLEQTLPGWPGAGFSRTLLLSYQFLKCGIHSMHAIHLQLHCWLPVNLPVILHACTPISRTQTCLTRLCSSSTLSLRWMLTRIM